MNPTRQAALSAARYAYLSLAERARAQTTDPELVDAIYLAWHERLDSLSTFRTDPTLSDETSRAVGNLISAVLRTPDTDADALMRWMDIYPETVAELFPPSESTFDLQTNEPELEEPIAEDEQVEAGSYALVA